MVQKAQYYLLLGLNYEFPTLSFFLWKFFVTGFFWIRLIFLALCCSILPNGEGFCFFFFPHGVFLLKIPLFHCNRSDHFPLPPHAKPFFFDPHVCLPSSDFSRERPFFALLLFSTRDKTLPHLTGCFPPFLRILDRPVKLLVVHVCLHTFSLLFHSSFFLGRFVPPPFPDFTSMFCLWVFWAVSLQR